MSHRPISENHGTQSSGDNYNIQLQDILERTDQLKQEKLRLSKEHNMITDQRIAKLNELLAVEASILRQAKYRIELQRDLQHLELQEKVLLESMSSADSKAARVKIEADKFRQSFDSAIDSNTDTKATALPRKSFSNCVQTFWHAGQVLALDVEPSSNLLYSSSSDHTVRVWSLQSFQQLTSLVGHSGPVYGITSILGGIAASSSSDGTVRLWKLDDHDLILSTDPNHQTHISVPGINTGSTTASFSDIGENTRTLELSGCAIFSVHMDNDRRNLLVSGDSNNYVRLWDVEVGSQIQSMNQHTAAVRCVKRCGHAIISSGADSRILFSDSRTGQHTRGFYGHKGTVNSFAFDDQLLISVSSDSTAKVWDLGTGRVIQTIQMSARPNCVARLGNTVAIGASDSLVHVFHSLETSRMMTQTDQFYGHESEIMGITLCGDLCITGSIDRRVKMWVLDNAWETGEGI